MCGDIENLYEILADRRQELSDGLGQLPRPGVCPENELWAQRGVYFFFEDGELRADGSTPRIVRVGSHTGNNSTIGTRINGEHAKDWGRSVFRRHVGTSLILRGDFPNGNVPGNGNTLAQHWYSSENGVAVHYNPNQLSQDLHDLHSLVTETIRNMSVLWIKIDNRDARLQFEKQCIRLLSNLNRPASMDTPSQAWLGKHALNEKIHLSGLWNVQHVQGMAHRAGFTFEQPYDVF